MEAVDNQYFSHPNQVYDPFYDWERHIINVGCNMSDLDLNNLSQWTSEEKKRFSNLIHEYIHFTQNFATYWGVSIFVDLAASVLKVCVASVPHKLSLPLSDADLNTGDLANATISRNAVLARINRCSKVEYRHNESVYLSGIYQVDTAGTCISLQSGQVRVEVGNKAIREHMAHIAAQLYLGLTDEDLHEFNRGNFKNEDVEFFSSPEYWIFYEYIYSLGCFIRVAQGVVLLMQCCLSYKDPEQCIKRFVSWMNVQLSIYNGNVDLVDFVNTWQMTAYEARKMADDLVVINQHYNRMLAMTAGSGHSLFTCVNKVARYAFANASSLNGGKLLFRPNDLFAREGYWVALMNKLGSGVIVYLDDVIIMGNPQHRNNMMRNFTLLASSSLLVKQMHSSCIHACPFMDEIPICTVAKRGSNECTENPFMLTHSGGSCLYQAGIELTKMDVKIKYQNSHI